MSTFRQAQNQAHPNKTNTLMLAILAVMILVVIMQIWLLTASLNTTLGDDKSIAWPAFYASLALFIGGAGLLRFLPDPLRRPVEATPAKSFAGEVATPLAWRTLAITLLRKEGVDLPPGFERGPAPVLPLPPVPANKEPTRGMTP